MISVGNLSVGGTAKTPMVACLARLLLERGERPAILSRGYGRRDRVDGVVVVSDGTRVLAHLDQAGDEPLMLARTLPGAIVAVSEDRYLAGVLAERCLHATVHLLDDGFQHVQLARDLDVLMTTPEEAHERVLPFGRLREATGAAARADVLVVLDADAATAKTVAWTLGVSQTVGATKKLAAAGATGAIGAAPVVAVAGIARPEQFFEMLRGEGYQVAAAIGFPDHHRYGAADVARVAAAVRAAGAAAVVTTEKDAVRWDALGTLPFACVAVPLELAIDDWSVMTALVEQALRRAREVA